ncbi:YitT family protein [Peptoniphilus sp.]|uniref:YitT family protein n=1 Tax=Peptoniphilus sp. TaxID=1971214 RepID=UPI003994A9AB
MLNKKLNFLDLSLRSFLRIVFGSAILAFAVLNVHDQSYVTEGGILGLMLFFKKMLGIDPSISSIVLDILCYILGYKILGREFIKKSMVATVLFAGFLNLFKFTGTILPPLYDSPFIAAVVGGILIGLGCGLVVTEGGATGGDDALALAISDKFNLSLAMVYIICDVVVLLMSISYIPVTQLVFSLLTTTISSVIVGQIDLKGRMAVAASA